MKKCFLPDSYISGLEDKSDDGDQPSASSARSKVKKSKREHDAGFLAGVVIGVIAGILVLSFVLGIALYKKFWYKSLHTINFDNPVYR